MQIKAEFDGDLSRLEKIMNEQAGSLFKVNKWETNEKVFYTLGVGPISVGCVYYEKGNETKLIASYELGILAKFFKNYAQKVFNCLVD